MPATPHPRKNPIHRNDAFKCENCHHDNPKANKGCRNHCRFCLHSKHVDKIVPGDRLSECQGLMEPIQIEFDRKKGQQIRQRCLKCTKIMLNKTAEDDNLQAIISLMKRHNRNNAKVFKKVHHSKNGK